MASKGHFYDTVFLKQGKKTCIVKSVLILQMHWVRSDSDMSNTTGKKNKKQIRCKCTGINTVPDKCDEFINEQSS